MARLPNRQFGVGGGIAPAPIAPAPATGVEALKQNWQFAKDAFEASSLARFGDAIEVERQGWRPATVDFNPADNIPKGYEAEGEAFMRADGPDQIELIRRQVDDNRALAKRREQYNVGALLVGDLFAEATNPLNYIGGPTAVGKGLIGGAARVGGFNMAVSVGEEALLRRDGMSTNEDSARNVLASGVLGGALGGVVGKVTTRNVVGPAKVSTRMPLPVEGGRIGSRFGPRVRPRTARGLGSANHGGVDIAAAAGTPVRASLGGKVIATTVDDGKNPNGNSVTIDHGGGVVTKYLHLSDFDVRVGATVLPNQKFGRVGSTGNSSGNHLHWAMEIDGKKVDPLTARLPEGVGSSVASPAHAVDAIVGARVPDVVDLPDGRAVPVVFGPTGSGAVASMRRARPREDIVDELTGLSGVDQPTARMAADGDEVDVSTPGLDFDRLINPDERFSNGRPLSKTALLGMFDDRLAVAEKKGGQDPEWMAQQRALVEAAYGEPDVRLPVDEAAARRAEAGPKAGRYAPDRPESGLDAVLDEPNGIRSRKLMAKAEGLFNWTEDALRLIGTPEAKLSSTLFKSGPRKGQPVPLSRKVILEMQQRALAEMQRAEDALDEVAYRDDGAPLGSEVGRIAREELDGPLDDGLAEIRDQDRAQRARDFDSGELADDLPFGRTHASDAGVGMDGDHIVFDMEAAIRGYSSKPWTRSDMEGVDPLPEDAFPTLKDWIDFSMIHEVTHAYNPRREGESVAAYENRIVQRALEQQRASKGSARVAGGVARLQTIKGTPIKDILDRVADPDAAIHRSIQQLASDGAMELEMGAMGGTPLAPGGSVFQRAHRWMREVYLLREAVRSGYLKYLGTGGEGGNRLGRELKIVGQRLPLVGAKARGQMTLDEFRAEVVRAQVGFDDVLPEAADAARVLDAGFVRMETEARGLGMFAGQRETRIAAGVKRRRAQQLVRDADDIARGGDDDLALDYREVAQRLEDEAAAMEARSFDTPVMPYKEPRYFPRMWNVAAIEANRDQLLGILAEAYRRVGNADPERAASNAIDLITTEPTGAFTHAPGSPNSLRHRDIPVANREVFDFIVTDPEVVTNGYYRRMGAALEMTRSFGDSAGLDELDVLRLDLRRRGVGDEDAMMALQRWMDARDRVAGGFHGSNPLSLGNRTARALKNFGSLWALGNVAKSQVSDPIKAVLVQGLGMRRLLDPDAPAGMIQGFASMFDGSVHRFNIGGPAKLSGEAMELSLARAASRFIEEDDVTFVGKQTWLERKLAAVQAPYSVINLLAPITTIVKEATGMVAAHNVLTDARLVNEVLQTGVAAKGYDAAVKRLARGGIDPVDAQLLATMPFEQEGKGLIMPNVMAWEGEAGERGRQLMLAAVNGEVRRSVITPAPLERPRWFDGVVVTKGAVKQSFAEMDAIERRVDSAQEALRALRGRPEDDPMRVAAQETLDELKAERYAARRNLGQKARKEVPLLALPAQLHSFAMSSGAKTLHGLMGSADRNKLGGLLGLLAGGLVVSQLKIGDRKWSEMDWDERLMSVVDNTGLLGIFGDVTKAIDAGFNLKLVPGAERDPDDETIGDEAGVWGGVAVSSAIETLNMVTGLAEDDAEMWATMRRLPGFEVFYIRYMLDGLVEALSPPKASGGAQVPGRDYVDEAAVVEDPARPGKMMLDPSVPLGASAPYGEPDLAVLPTATLSDEDALDVGTYVEGMEPEVRERIMAKAKKKGRKRRTPRAIRPGIAALL